MESKRMKAMPCASWPRQQRRWGQQTMDESMNRPSWPSFVNSLKRGSLTTGKCECQPWSLLGQRERERNQKTWDGNYHHIAEAISRTFHHGQGHPESMHNLGVKLYFGEGMESDRPCMEALIFPGFASLVSSLDKAMVVTNKKWCVYIYI